MAEQYYVRTVDLRTGEETVSEPTWRKSEAADYAERLAGEFYGGDDVTWFEQDGGTYQVGRLMEDGTRSVPTIRITIEEEAT